MDTMSVSFNHDVIARLRQVIAAETHSSGGRYLQRDFAKTLDITPAHLSMILNGSKPLSLAIIRKVHVLYNVPLDVLLSPTPVEMIRKKVRKRAKAGAKARAK